MSDKALHAIRSALLSNGWTDPAQCDYEPTAAAILAALKAAGIAVVELPEPTERVGNFPHWRTVRESPNAVTWTAPGCHVMIQNVEPGDLQSAQARDLAAALLAAADAAEKADPVPRIEPPKCSLCRRERTLDDAYDYNPIQAITGKPRGWYSGDGGEVCPECMTRTLRG